MFSSLVLTSSLLLLTSLLVFNSILIMSHFNLATLNINGARDVSKRASFYSLIGLSLRGRSSSVIRAASVVEWGFYFLEVLLPSLWRLTRSLQVTF